MQGLGQIAGAWIAARQRQLNILCNCGEPRCQHSKSHARGLAPENLRATVEALQAVMFWPRDQDRREAFLRTCDAARRAELAEAVPGAFAPADLTTLIRDALHVRAPAEWRDEMEQRLYRGTLVGIFFAECWNNRVRGKSVSVKQVYNLMTTDQWRMQHPEADVSAKTLEAAIRDFRPAGPLWAATVIRFQVFKEVFHPTRRAALSSFSRLLNMCVRPQPRRRSRGGTSLYCPPEPMSGARRTGFNCRS